MPANMHCRHSVAAPHGADNGTQVILSRASRAGLFTWIPEFAPFGATPE
jgi:hypothetical protein